MIDDSPADWKAAARRWVMASREIGDTDVQLRDTLRGLAVSCYTIGVDGKSREISKSRQSRGPLKAPRKSHKLQYVESRFA